MLKVPRRAVDLLIIQILSFFLLSTPTSNCKA